MTELTRLTAQELELMKVIWRRHPVTVRDVYEVLRQHRKIAYTTVMTMMGILEKKGHLERAKEGRAYLYKPTRPQHKTVAALVRDFVDKVFDGSAKPLVMNLVEDEAISAEDWEDIMGRIDGIEEADKAGETEEVDGIDGERS